MIDQLETDVEMVARHLRVLAAVRAEEPIGIVKLSRATEISQHKVRYSLGLLEDEGVITPTTKGAATTDETKAFVEQVDDQLAELAVGIENVREVGR